MLLRTELFEVHQSHGARLVEFGGWEMPVQYTSIMEEHQMVRTQAGLFDIAHMGEVAVRGEGAAAFLNQILTNNIHKLNVGEGQYTLMCNDSGGVIDDLYAYRIDENEYLLIINASRIDVDLAWITTEASRHRGTPLAIEDLCATWGAIALQGPTSKAFIDSCFGAAKTAPSTLKKNQITSATFNNETVYIARTGYTGEDGFEIVAPSALLVPLWKKILAQGAPHGCKPAGLGARDTLRTEVCYPLYGHELDETTTPLEAGLGFFVSFDKGGFNGRDTLAAQQAHGVQRRCVAFKMTDKSAPPRPHYPVWSVGPEAGLVGEVVSGTQSPSLSVGIGMAYVPIALAQAGTKIEIEIRGRRFAAEVVKKPIYRKAS